MANGWIKIEPSYDGNPKKIKDISCKITFYDSVSVILEDNDRDYLIRSLQRFKKFKEVLGEVRVNG